MLQECKDNCNNIDRITAELEEQTLERNRIECRRSRLTAQLQILHGHQENYQLYRNLNVVAN